MINDAIINVDSNNRVMYVVFEPLLRRILYIWVYDVINMFTSLTFLKKINAIYGSNIIVLSGDVHHHGSPCEILNSLKYMV
ncbi:MAG: hypothetical protein QW534_11230 [Candidatus Methanomethylicia archaeon]